MTYVTNTGSRPLSIEEVSRVAESARTERDACMFTLACTTGLRARELLSVTLGQVWDGSRVRDFVQMDADKTKGGKRGRRQPLTTGARNSIARYLQERGLSEGLLFDIGYHAFRNAFMAAVEHAGIDATEVTLHSLRKAGATAVCEVAGLGAAQGFCGHSSASTTLRYIGSVTDVALRNAVEKAIKL